jgi:hypothetical protein
MKITLALTLAAGLVSSSAVLAAMPQNDVGGLTLAKATTVLSFAAGTTVRLARNGADDPANHDLNDDRRGVRGLHHARRGRGLDDGPLHDLNDDNGGRRDDNGSSSGNSSNSNSGSGNSGSGSNSGSGNSGSNSGSGSSGSGGHDHD